MNLQHIKLLNFICKGKHELQINDYTILYVKFALLLISVTLRLTNMLDINSKVYLLGYNIV
jgi:hypothetical protein